MYTYKSPTFNYVYSTLVRDVMDKGSLEVQRGLTTRELHPVIIEVRDPLQRLVSASGRPINVPFALAEVLWILGGRQDVDMLSFYNTKIGDYSDDGEVFNAAYGNRLRRHFGFDQLDDVVRTLCDDPGSRQAVLNVWSPERDRGWDLVATAGDGTKAHHVPHVTKDRACNVMAHPMIRNGKLDWLQVVRSNDAMWGAPYNWVQWSYIQEYLATRVGVPVGNYVHVADSLHIYDWHWDEARQVRPFDIYMELGNWRHHPMWWANDELLGEVMAIEASVRRSGVVLHELARMPLDWQRVLQVLHAHAAFKAKDDELAFVRLTQGSPDLAYMAATLRFWWSIRWGKTDQSFASRIQGLELPEPVVDWIMEVSPRG